PVPAAAAKDRRWGLIARVAEEDEDLEDDEAFGDEEDFGQDDEFYGEEADEDDEDEFEEEEAPAPRGRRSPVAARLAGAVEQADKAKGKKRGSLRAYLEGLPAAELVNLLMRFAEDYPDLAEELSERRAVASGKTGELLRQARKEMTRVTGERGDWDSWHGGVVPAYSGLKKRLEDPGGLGEAGGGGERGRERVSRGAGGAGES